MVAGVLITNSKGTQDSEVISVVEVAGVADSSGTKIRVLVEVGSLVVSNRILLSVVMLVVGCSVVVVGYSGTTTATSSSRTPSEGTPVVGCLVTQTSSSSRTLVGYSEIATTSSSNSRILVASSETTMPTRIPAAVVGYSGITQEEVVVEVFLVIIPIITLVRLYHIS